MTPEILHNVNIFLGSGAILLQVLSLVVLVLLVVAVKNKKSNIFLNFIKNNFLVISFLVSLAAMLLSLFYSNVVGFLPCVLCWYQRIFMFPLVFIFGIALYKKDGQALTYATPLAVVGLLFALYQNFFYYFGTKSDLPCDASGVSCYQRIISEFGGYISFPMFSLTVFASLLVVFLVAHFYKRV